MDWFPYERALRHERVNIHDLSEIQNMYVN